MYNLKILTVCCAVITLAGCREPDVRSRAESGDPVAQHELGRAYYDGKGVVKNDVQAFSWYRKAADQGYAPSQGELGFMYHNGYGVSKDHSEALKWYLKSAVQGDDGAAYQLGKMYAFGHGVLIDYVEAYAWFLCAGSSEAKELGRKMTAEHVSLAELRYQTILREVSRATFKAAEGGGVKEKLRHGGILLSLRDYSLAMEWFLGLAKQGNPDAQCVLGMMYYQGMGVPQNYTNFVESYAWFNLAVAGGSLDAKKQIDSFSEKMSPELVFQGQARSKVILREIEANMAGKKDGK